MQDILNGLSKIIPKPILLDELLAMSIITTILAIIIVLKVKSLTNKNIISYLFIYPLIVTFLLILKLLNIINFENIFINSAINSLFIGIYAVYFYRKSKA